jgi:hypothetical protein
MLSTATMTMSTVAMTSPSSAALATMAASTVVRFLFRGFAFLILHKSTFTSL